MIGGPVGDGWLGHTWSLSVEEQFYLFWPLILLAIFRSRFANIIVWLTLLLAFMSIAWRIGLLNTGATEDRIYNGFDTRADGLLIGCALALSRPFYYAKIAARFCLVPLAILAIVFFYVPWISLNSTSSIVIGLATAWLILPLWAGTAPTLSKFLELNPARYIGRNLLRIIPVALASPSHAGAFRTA